MLVENEDLARERLQRVFRFLQALDQHRNPVKRQVSENKWILKLQELPVHQAVSFFYPQLPGSETDIVFRVRRPILTNCPEPHSSLTEWLEPQWQNPFKKAVVKKSILRQIQDGEPYEELLADKQGRKQAYEKWVAERDAWAEKEIPARRSNTIYEHVYELHGLMQKEEGYEIIVGDGILNWRRSDGGIHFPLLLQRLQLVFKPEIPEFQFIEDEISPELYTALFQSIEGIDGTFLSEFHSQPAENFHPLGGEQTSTFLTKLVHRLSPRGKFLDNNPIYGEEDEPRIGRSPIIFARKRTAGFSNALQKIIENISRVSPDMESAILNILGIGTIKSISSDNENRQVSDIDVLLGKSANPEQIQIAQTIDKSPGVLVQGPPGTGKTHTIANLIGHFLAQGKTILVTSHTTKALKVLRDKMVTVLKPLCVSVLNKDAESRTQLKNSVQGIIEHISTFNTQSAERKVKELEQHRLKLFEDLAATKHSLLRARADEYTEIVVGDIAYTPSEAAKLVSKGFRVHDWIPRPAVELKPLVLAPIDIAELYKTNSILTTQDEIELSESFPKTKALPSLHEFESLATRFETLLKEKKPSFPSHWVCVSDSVTEDQISSCINHLEIALEPLISKDPWKTAVLYAGMHRRETAWQALLDHVKEVVRFAAEAEIQFARYHPEITIDANHDDTIKTLNEIIDYLKNKGSFGLTTLWLKPSWKKLIAYTSTCGTSPSRWEHFEAIRSRLILHTMREELVRIWDSLMCKSGAPDVRELEERPEDFASQFIGHVEYCLAWHGEVWGPLVDELTAIHVHWEALLADQPPNASKYGDIVRLSEAATGPLQEILLSLKNEALLREIKEQQFKLLDYIRHYEVSGKAKTIISALFSAIERFDSIKYRKILERIYELEQLAPVLERRNLLLQMLSKAAPNWADAIQNRDSIHDSTDPPGDVIQAWTWLQLKQELDRRNAVSFEVLQDKIEKLNKEIQLCTNELINLKAWYYQRKRTGLKQQQALIGYAETVNKMGAGTGKLAPQLRAQAMELVKECRQAVPVWIMSLARVVETFDPANTKFDVVIIDEASQCDVMGLIAMYIAKKVIIVGDHEQVSPLAIGQKLDIVNNLINQHLIGVPLAKLYDGQTSIYDLARASFGSLICLTEHFRCVPDIIQFSNLLSYEGKIKPLRDASSSTLHPATIVHYVPNASSNKKVNLIEADEVVKIVIGATKLEEYKNKTFGIITLLGEEQAIEIERRLRRAIPEKEYDARNIICGTAAHFQGDERDVMFLSVVEGPPDKPPLRLLSYGYQDRYKKRYNVAASRAKDQLWVIHSLQPGMDLQPNDLRSKLIQFAENPSASIQKVTQDLEKTDSGFERDVIQRLRKMGYWVTPQWKVGHYRIDMVVEGAEHQKLAIECDGDRYHTIEKLKEDMMRQAVLERLGWRFVRIRGSRYYQNPEEALIPVFTRLAELGIEPLTSKTPTNNTLEDKLLYYKVIEAAGINRDTTPAILEEGYEENDIFSAKELTEPTDLNVGPRDVNENSDASLNAPLSAPETATSIAVTVPHISNVTDKVPPLKVTVPKKLKSDNKHWVQGTSKDLWFKLSHWGKETQKLEARERKLSFDIGMGISKKWTLTQRQLAAAEQLYKKAIENGFNEKTK
jgi:very-short-patch-repair endonuclease/DNA polymerase III delta prime subunit